MAGVVIVKLGGSVITDKTKEFVYRNDVASALAEEIAASDINAVVVHGGGSFGHPNAIKYGLSYSSYKKNPDGVWQTRSSMYELSMQLCKTMYESKLKPYLFSPYNILMLTPSRKAVSWLNNLIKLGLTPVTFGDVIVDRKGATILSGDTIVYNLSKILKPKRVVFAMDVDGLYEKQTSVIIPEITRRRLGKIVFAESRDATGGIKQKVLKAAKIASLGIEVRFVSGYRRNEFAKALRGEDFYGTKIIP